MKAIGAEQAAAANPWRNELVLGRTARCWCRQTRPADAHFASRAVPKRKYPAKVGFGTTCFFQREHVLVISRTLGHMHHLGHLLRAPSTMCPTKAGSLTPIISVELCTLPGALAHQFLLKANPKSPHGGL